LKGNPNVEQIPKADVLTRLKKATSETKSGEYHKIKHAPKLLQEFAPNCDRMFRLILAALG